MNRNMPVAFILISTVIVVSSILLNSSITNATPTNDALNITNSNLDKFVGVPTTATVMRMVYFNDKQVSEYPSLGTQSVGKYAVLQDAINEADKRYDEYIKVCSDIPCEFLSRSPPVQLTYLFQVQGDLADMIINDSGFNFHKEYKNSFISNVKIGNGIYFIRISSDNS